MTPTYDPIYDLHSCPQSCHLIHLPTMSFKKYYNQRPFVPFTLHGGIDINVPSTWKEQPTSAASLPTLLVLLWQIRIEYTLLKMVIAFPDQTSVETLIMLLVLTIPGGRFGPQWYMKVQTYQGAKIGTALTYVTNGKGNSDHKNIFYCTGTNVLFFNSIMVQQTCLNPLHRL